MTDPTNPHALPLPTTRTEDYLAVMVKTQDQILHELVTLRGVLAPPEPAVVTVTDPVTIHVSEPATVAVSEPASPRRAARRR